MRKTDISKLPRWENGKNKGQINWNECIGLEVPFEYDDVKGVIKIINREKDLLTVKYLGEQFNIRRKGLVNCCLKTILKKKTKDFKIEIGTVFKDDKRDITIIKKEYRKSFSFNKARNKTYKRLKKMYKYHCNKCGFEDWKEESGILVSKSGCPVCGSSSQKVVYGINSIYDTNYDWIKRFGISESDAKKYSNGTKTKIKVVCPNCKREKKMTIANIKLYNSICCDCGDGISYPEKVMIYILDNIGIEYIHEYKPLWCKFKDYNTNGIRTGRYDFYIPSKNLIIEMDGGFHYTNNNLSGQSNDELQYIDRQKDILAKNNNINIIRIDCYYTHKNRFEYIKNNIIQSELQEIIDLSKIDWFKCEEFALSNYVKKVCDYWHLHNDINNENIEIKEMSKIFKRCPNSITKYLKQGANIGWCDYKPKTERKIEIFKNGKSLGIFKNASEIKQLSVNLFGVQMNNTLICAVCRGERLSHRGYTFKYVS